MLYYMEPPYLPSVVLYRGFYSLGNIMKEFTRLNVNIPTYWKKELKDIAKKHNTTVTKIVLQGIIQRIIKERKY